MNNFKSLMASEFTYSFSEKKGGEIHMYWLTGFAGALLLAAPFIFSYADNTAALWTSIIAGVVVACSSLWEGLEAKKQNWEYWVVGIVGIAAILAPFALGFGNHQTAMWTTIIMGAVFAVLAGGKLWTSETL